MKRSIFICLLFSQLNCSEPDWEIVESKPETPQKFIALVQNYMQLQQFRLQKALFDAVDNNDIDGVIKAVNDGADLNAKNGNGLIALAQAYNKGYKKICAILRLYLIYRNDY